MTEGSLRPTAWHIRGCQRTFAVALRERPHLHCIHNTALPRLVAIFAVINVRLVPTFVAAPGAAHSRAVKRQEAPVPKSSYGPGAASVARDLGVNAEQIQFGNICAGSAEARLPLNDATGEDAGGRRTLRFRLLLSFLRRASGGDLRHDLRPLDLFSCVVHRMLRSKGGSSDPPGRRVTGPALCTLWLVSPPAGPGPRSLYRATPAVSLASCMGAHEVTEDGLVLVLAAGQFKTTTPPSPQRPH